MDRVIFLVDMNSFFISCELTRHPELAGKPAAVAGNPRTRTGIILTANYEARKFGIKTTMVVHEALKLCPGLVLVPPDHHFYEEKSRQVMAILSDFTPIVEENSIDEAWLDMTGCEGIFGSPLDSAKQIMDRLRDELGLPCSIGISENKFLSKMASEMKKPMGITELWKKDIERKLWPLPVRSMYGVGKQTTLKLQAMGIETIGNLANSDKLRLVKKLGKAGSELHDLANGIGESRLSAHDHDSVKSIGRSITLSRDITDLNEARAEFLEMAEEIGLSARKEGKKGRTIQITIKYADFRSITRQTTIQSTCHTGDIFSHGFELLSKNWNSKQPVRLLGLTLTGFDNEPASEQLSIFDTKEQPVQDEKVEKLENALDSLRDKYGKSIVNRAALINKKHRK
ncbi:MAG: DNA polymerase IV [Clostridiaceae bacterium]